MRWAFSGIILALGLATMAYYKVSVFKNSSTTLNPETISKEFSFRGESKNPRTPSSIDNEVAQLSNESLIKDYISSGIISDPTLHGDRGIAILQEFQKRIKNFSKTELIHLFQSSESLVLQNTASMNSQQKEWVQEFIISSLKKTKSLDDSHIALITEFPFLSTNLENLSQFINLQNIELHHRENCFGMSFMHFKREKVETYTLLQLLENVENEKDKEAFFLGYMGHLSATEPLRAFETLKKYSPIFKINADSFNNSIRTIGAHVAKQESSELALWTKNLEEEGIKFNDDIIASISFGLSDLSIEESVRSITKISNSKLRIKIAVELGNTLSRSGNSKKSEYYFQQLSRYPDIWDGIQNKITSSNTHEVSEVSFLN